MSHSETPVPQKEVEEILADWPEEPTEIAEDMIDEYGWPDEAAPSEMLWYDNGPWKRSELYRDGVPHHFPKEHTDYLKQTINYHAPPEKYDELGKFDGSVYPDRTNGELAAKCDKEAMNFLAINLAHDIIEGEKTVDEARHEYAVTAMKAMMGADSEYTEGFAFSLPEGDQRDPDDSIVTDAMREEVKEKVEDVTRSEEE